MLFTVKHRISYSYDHPVFPEPHTIRMRPRSDVQQRLVSFAMQITPDAAGYTENVDISGGSATFAWFDGMTSSLIFEATSVVETTRENPFDFILPDALHNQLPLSYSDNVQKELAPFLTPITIGPLTHALIEEGRSAVNNDTLVFPTWLVEQIRSRVEHTTRHDTGLLDSETVLQTGKGACRDAAALFVTACRSVGIAARFVSGYQASDNEEERRELHGWAEIYLPGGGWRSYDPAAGIACGAEYIVITSKTMM